MEYVSLILLIVLGAAMAAAPRVFWKLEHFFSVKGGEPTELYLALTRLSGALFVLTGLGIFFWLVFGRM
ncbi:MAG: hypothetical protein SOX72_00870 [Oscillospiraceae bacterium]|nr:hypothetical protein [Oscillospiraceae bacterium]MDY4190756.1 hypothetical protein [Oscillospiraceae bacterium]